MSKEARLEELMASRAVASSHEALEAIDAEIKSLSEGNGSPQKKKRKRRTSPEVALAVNQIGNGADFGAVLVELSKSISVHEIHENRKALLDAYAQTGQTDGEVQYDAAMVEITAEPSKVPHLSHHRPLDSADAFLSIVHSEEDLRLLHRYQGEFHRWVGTHYAILDDPIVRGQVWRFLPEGKVKPNSGRVSNVIDAVQTQTHLPSDRQAPFWLTDPIPDYPALEELIPLKNGLLHPTTEKLYKPTPKIFSRFSLPFDYDPSDKEPPAEWLRFLDTLWGKDAELNGYSNDPQSIDCLQEIIGYLLTQDTTQEKMFFIQGPPRSGKGTIGRVLEWLLGEENVASCTLASLSGEHGMQNLPGKSLALFPDAMVTAKTDIIRAAETLKMISGRDPIPINPKNKAPYSARLNLHIVLMANLIPRFADASTALARRFVVLKMTRSFSGEEDLGLQVRLKKETPKILHWALAGLRRLRSRGEGGYFIPPDSAHDLMRELEEQSSPMSAFVEDRCEVGSGNEILRDALWEEWRSWVEKRGENPGQLNWFIRDLRACIPKLRTDRRDPNGERRVWLRGVGVRV